MEKKIKTKSVEDSFVSSDCSELENRIQKWFDAETERLVSKGEDINNIFIVADPYYNEGTIICDDYTLSFNRTERVIDLVVKGEKNSSIWEDVISNVPVQFASCIDNPMSYTYNISTNTSEEKESYFMLPNSTKLVLGGLKTLMN